uniref:Uncharacterized protein n=1 Tax=Siphoviridae sp. ct96x5 TaxID=2825367 RepID=A0A8S5PS00_9CAUD|nr:MAG TPA: hypothetical protein [Siphoviridae sp. ct96x5]
MGLLNRYNLINIPTHLLPGGSLKDPKSSIKML